MANDFFHGQGYGIIKNILYQYNQSEIGMEENDRNYCTVSSIYINIRYFLSRTE